MKIANAVALVTGSNRGVGAGFVDALFARGAAKVYAGARNPADLADARARYGDRLVPVTLDVTVQEDIEAAAAACPDVSLLISNAGIECSGAIVHDPDPAKFHHVMAVNAFGPMHLTRAFAPHLERSTGAVAYVLSMAGLLNVAQSAAYSASKAACAQFALGVKADLGAKGVGVTIAYPGFIDTRMSSAFAFPKASPRQIAERTLDGVEAGTLSVFPDVFAEMTMESFRTNADGVFANPHAVLGAQVGAFLKRPDAGR
jgi:NAD(P)-dependent dehydrogenase (short-subunit alcohol dehydrogenase family)